MGPGKGWQWLTRAVNLGSRNAKALFGAAALLLVIAMVPTLLQALFLRGSTQPNMSMVGGWTVFALLYALLVVPPAMAGLLKVIHATETGVPTQATAIFDGYRDRPGRVIGLMIVTVVLGIVILSLILALFVALFGGSELFSNLGELMTAAQSAKPGTAQVVPELPSGFGTLLLVLLLVLVGVIFNGVYALSLGQVVLAERSIGEALRDGISGTLKNLLPLLILMVIALVVGSLAAVVVVLLLGMLNLVGGFIHPTVGMILAAPLYLVTMLAVYVISFGVMYFMWRDICADGDSAPVRRDDQLEV